MESQLSLNDFGGTTSYTLFVNYIYFWSFLSNKTQSFSTKKKIINLIQRVLKMSG